MPGINLKFSFNYTNDLAATRRFYGESIGMQELHHKDDEAQGFVVYQSDGFQFMFFRAETPLPVVDEFAGQPGWQGGNGLVPSWAMVVPEADFPAIIARVREAGAPCFAEQPMWCQDSYWSFPVRDPNGTTVEIYTEPAERPASTEWGS